MKFPARAFLFCASLAGCLAGCDEDVGAAEPEEMRIPDAGPVAVKVTEVGASCSLLHRGCAGSAAQCLEISNSGAFYPGGYCTANCKLSEECGANAACPVGEAERVSSDYAFRSTWARKCFKTCTPGALGSCRPGYACKSLAEVYETADAPPPMHQPVCVPSWPTLSWDAGVPADAGRQLDAGRL